jgi:Fur family ferric uptake transcriptional regulator
MKPKEKNKIDSKKVLDTAGLKNTAPRVAILEVLSKIKNPETAQNIHKKLKNIDLVTLYRTLVSFGKGGLLRKVDLHRNTVYYELNIDHHHHIVCLECNKIEDFENLEVEKMLGKIARKSLNFGNIKNHSLELFGLCRKCA